MLEECITCRVTGGAALTGTGIYAVWSSRPKALGSPMGKRLIGLMGGGTVSHLLACQFDLTSL
ncbi:hypothetical protein FRC16_005658 [Serendipita sp. 398]|nr:hypothetical protein FRC16_005658 [Serendipita sp. 398]